MTNLLSIFDYYNSYPTNEIHQSIDFLTRKRKNRLIFNELIININDVKAFLNKLETEEGFRITDGHTSIDYMMLSEALKDGRIKKYVMVCKEVRAELLCVSEESDFSRFKEMNEYWESLELSFMQML